MPNYVEYQKSISNELLSIKDRVRNFIDDHHWGEDGRYKEIILSHIVRQHLPIENTKEAYRAKTIEIEKEKAHDEF